MRYRSLTKPGQKPCACRLLTALNILYSTTVQLASRAQRQDRANIRARLATRRVYPQEQDVPAGRQGDAQVRPLPLARQVPARLFEFFGIAPHQMAFGQQP